MVYNKNKTSPYFQVSTSDLKGHRRACFLHTLSDIFLKVLYEQDGQ